MIRKLIPFVAAIALAFVVAGLVEVAELSSVLASALVGFLAGIISVAGTIFAFSDSLQERHVMKPRESAVGAKEDDDRVASPHRKLPLPKDLDETWLISLPPVITPAGFTRPGRFGLLNGTLVSVRVGHHVHPTTRMNRVPPTNVLAAPLRPGIRRGA